MEVELPYKSMFAIVSLPRSGSTILSNYFNSLDNGFSISEPYWALKKCKYMLKWGKVTPQEECDIETFQIRLENFLFESDYLLGGFKEIYRPNEEFTTKEIWNSPYLDFVIFLFRDPVQLYNSITNKWLSKCWYSGIDEFVSSYKSLYDKYLEEIYNKPCFLLRYEDFAKMGSYYINLCFDGYLKIKGKEKIIKSGQLLGDDKAHVSSELIYKKNKLNQYTVHNRGKIEELYDIYYKLDI